MFVITAPTYVEHFERPSIFLGGSITGAADWQDRAVEFLRGSFATFFNPRRPRGFAAPEHPDFLERYREQVAWEHRYLLTADVVLFWMAKRALSVTTRFEIGWFFGMRFSAESKETARRFAVGIEPGVRGDTYYHVLLPEIGVPVHTTLQDTCAWARTLVGH